MKPEESHTNFPPPVNLDRALPGARHRQVAELEHSCQTPGREADPVDSQCLLVGIDPVVFTADVALKQHLGFMSEYHLIDMLGLCETETPA
jgi:hypothetical protein